MFINKHTPLSPHHFRQETCLQRGHQTHKRRSSEASVLSHPADKNCPPPPPTAAPPPPSPLNTGGPTESDMVIWLRIHHHGFVSTTTYTQTHIMLSQEKQPISCCHRKSRALLYSGAPAGKGRQGLARAGQGQARAGKGRARCV